ncbi:MAG: AAA family ATPase [Ignavibacteriaceae bacterium]|nr:AAA family ATPase [Ignavibacteriaceae bacterium]
MGKTTLAKEIVAAHFNVSNYLNWDYQPDRKKIIAGILPAEESLIIFDEIHKYKKMEKLR